MVTGRIDRRAFLMGSGAALALLAAPAAGQPNRSRQPSQRVRDLLSRMSIEEKAGQLTLMPTPPESFAASFNPQRPGTGFAGYLQDAAAGRLTGIFNLANVDALRQLQGAARQSRLGIPLIFAADVIHGFKTVFPVPLAEASSFDPLLCERTARASAVEAAASGLDWTFAPMVDIARDARWGRIVEGAGEDVLLGRDLAAARVRGFQGRRLSDDDAVLACPKHLAGYGAVEGGLDYNSVDMSERTLREVHLPPFQAAFAAGAMSTMASFNDINGVPAHGNRWLLDAVLRREWDFTGLTVSDYTGDLELVAHGYAADEREATRMAIMAGVDMSMASGLYRTHLPALVAAGEVPMARVDEAVARVLTVKEQLGLLDDPFRRLDPMRAAQRIGTPAHLALAREAGRKSVVMLKNDGDLLPLAPSARIALIGPFAEGAHDLVGPWTVFGRDRESVDVATGFRAAMPDPTRLTVVAGSAISAPVEGGIEAAVAAASQADVVVMAIGEGGSMTGEAVSRTDIIIPPAQAALVEAVSAVGKPMLILLKTGRPLALDGAVLNARAILVTWFLGSQTGHAIADLVFGRESPSGRLPVSFPRRAGQVPYYYAHRATGRPNAGSSPQPFRTHYFGITNTALFPFGHGLTYGRFAYSDLSIDASSLGSGGRASIAATITNSGPRPARELVQLYVNDVAASLTRPVRELKAYRWVDLEPGQSRRVTFQLEAADLSFLGPDMRPRLEPGLFRVWIAPSAETEGVTGTFTLTRGA